MNTNRDVTTAMSEAPFAELLSWRNWFSLEGIFVFFLLSGEFKNATGIHTIIGNVDVGGLVLGFCGFLAPLIALLKKVTLTNLTLVVLLVYGALNAWIFASYGFSPYSSHAELKFIEFIFINNACVLLALIFYSSRPRLRRFLGLFFFSAAVLSAATLVNTMLGVAGATGAFGGFAEGGYHRTGRFAGGALLISSICILLTSRKTVIFGHAVFMALFLVGLLLSAHRAGMVSYCLTLLILPLLAFLFSDKDQHRMNWNRPYGLILFSALVASVGVSFTARGGYLIHRFISLMGAAADNIRVEMYKKSFFLISENPIVGVGFGNFPSASGMTEYRHPHNIFIEGQVELGIIGTLLLFLFLFSWAPLAFKRRPTLNWDVLCLISLFCFFLINAQISGNFSDNRILFFLAGALAAIVGRHHKRKNFKYTSNPRPKERHSVF